MLVTMKDILIKSREGKYGVVAPNVSNEDTARAAIEAAEENRAPIVLDILYKVNPDIPFFAHICIEMAHHASVPVAINLDHGGTFEQAIIAIRAGFSSIMVDRSSLAFEDNIAEVKKLVDIAHAVGVTVEAELGHVGSGANYAQDGVTGFTDPAQAAEYVERTGVDALAIAMGTAHGKYVGEPKLHFDILKACYEAVDVPLVLHGGSGSGDQNLARATREGITKVNIGTDLYQAGIDALVANADKLQRANNAYDVFREAYKQKLVYYIKLFRQDNQA